MRDEKDPTITKSFDLLYKDWKSLAVLNVNIVTKFSKIRSKKKALNSNLLRAISTSLNMVSSSRRFRSRPSRLLMKIVDLITFVKSPTFIVVLKDLLPNSCHCNPATGGSGNSTLCHCENLRDVVIILGTRGQSKNIHMSPSIYNKYNKDIVIPDLIGIYTNKYNFKCRKIKKTTLSTKLFLSPNAAVHLPGSEIYGGLANTYDFGPLGTELKRNLMNYWWRTFVTSRADMLFRHFCHHESQSLGSLWPHQKLHQRYDRLSYLSLPHPCRSAN